MPPQGDEEDDAGNVEQGDAEDEDLVSRQLSDINCKIRQL